MPKLQQNCGNCRFLDDTDTGEKPRCHRYPPQLQDTRVMSEDPLLRSLEEVPVWRFPEMDKSNWCGEWQPILNSGSISAYDKE